MRAQVAQVGRAAVGGGAGGSVVGVTIAGVLLSGNPRDPILGEPDYCRRSNFTRRSAAVLPRTAGLRTARRTAGLSRPREPELSESAGLQIQIGEAPGTAHAAV